MMSKTDVLKKIQEFVIEHKDAPTAWRPELVRQLTDELQQGGVEQRLYWMWKMRHPSLLKKSAAYQTIGDILADFIMNIGEVAERGEEYPVRGAEKTYREEVRSNEHEVVLRFERSELNPDFQPRGTVFEDAIPHTNSVEEALYGERTDMSEEELAGILTSVKQHPREFIGQYADGSPWNRETVDKRRSAENIGEALARIDMRRVRVCKVCGNAFYSHSAQPGRVKVCDILPHHKQKPKSICQVERDRLLAKIRRVKAKTA
ncbi:hypothetical protein MHB71_15335 [Paenibacillus sp. FSL H7-0940]|uniref:hypothetical protein n=1 Tax=Paenibacillus sp. FSL H7-0940 TaxID=2921443 RepID=UPI0030EC8617